VNSEEHLEDGRDYEVVARCQLELEWRIQHIQHLEGLKVLAGGIANDLNNLLMAILGNTDLMMQYISPMDPIGKNLSRIKESVGKASELTHQMISYISNGDMVLEALNLKRIIIETEKMLRLSPAKRAIVQFSLDDVPAMNGDVSQIIRLVLNMLTNATEITCPDHGTISISLKSQHMTREDLNELCRETECSEGEYIVLKVLDTECGLDRDTLMNMFGPFYRTELTGRGLGMASALELVRNQNGAISVKFERDGEKSVTVIFPSIVVASGRPETPCVSLASIAPGKTILLVDDDQMVLATTSEILEGIGYTVVRAKDGCDAVEKFRSGESLIDCVILDLSMPDLNGSQTFSILRRLKPNIPVILSSGFIRDEAIRNGESKGFDGFLQKPYDIVQLQDMLTSVLEK
jgi:two-component system cell cycle sensor histidine kinase/response regulator CckA